MFLTRDFLLKNDTAKKLYHDFAAEMPIVDYHCHINPQEIYEDRKFDSITRIWLGGDHYKWRLIRSNGVNEDEITGNADAKITYFQLNILENFPAYKEALMQSFPKIFTSGVCNDIETYRQGMTLFGLDMTRIPHWKDGIIVIIPILSLVTSLGSSVVSTIIQKKNNPAASQQNAQMMMMMLMMPFFSFYIAFKVTAAVGFYWTISNIIAILQQIYIFKVHPPKRTQARLMVENTIERRSREENIKKMTK